MTTEAPEASAVAAAAPERPRPLLRVQDIAVNFHGRSGRRQVRAVDGVSFDINEGQTLGLVGESGCGKSTLARTILGLIAPDQGQILYRGRATSGMTRRELRALRPKIQVVFQDPQTALDPKMTVHDLVAEPLRINRRYDPRRVAELLDHVGLNPDLAGRHPAGLSGGQRQRIGIARALALDPELIVLDEPVSALDVSIQAQVITLLKRLQRELGLSYLFIAHDLAVVRHMSDHVAVMYLGRIVETGWRDEIFDSPRHPYTQSLLAAVPIASMAGRDERRNRPLLVGEPPDPARLPVGCRFHTRCERSQALCLTDDPAPDQDRGTTTHTSACHFPTTSGLQLGRPADQSAPLPKESRR